MIKPLQNITKNNTISARDLWGLVDDTFDLMHPQLHRHHQMVSYLSYCMAVEAEFPVFLQHLTLQAAYLHDIGAVLEKDRMTLEDIEQAGYHAAQISANLLEDFPHFIILAGIVRHSQTPYRSTKGLKLSKLKLPELPIFPEQKTGAPNPAVVNPIAANPVTANPAVAANIIHLADTVSLRIRPDIPVLNQVSTILEEVKEQEGDEFSPQAVSALEKLEKKEQVWLDLCYAPQRILDLAVQEDDVGVGEALQIARLIAVIIDFRSPFTAMHSAGVAASAKALAGFAGMSAQECEMMEIAGNLHDLGKIRTPNEILEKPGKLMDEEFNVIKEHAYFTDLLLSKVRGFEQISGWAASHHEKPNGSGYPYHMKDTDIPMGAKIMAVADVFSAITEERPYRKGMPVEKVKEILNENAEGGNLSKELVHILIRHFDEINGARDAASREAGRRYYRSLEKVK